jgi:hypothetical protein
MFTYLNKLTILLIVIKGTINQEIIIFYIHIKY